MRLALGIEYDGAGYNGWQRQHVGLGVQQVLEGCVSQVANETVTLTCAGRTDTGVHASGQVAHFDTGSIRDMHGWLLGINSALPDDISVRWVREVPPEFHARFDAIDRRYRYRILNRLERSALERHRCWWVHQAIDAQAMHAAAQTLLGEHDFSAFRAAGCQAKSPHRELRTLRVHRTGDWVDLEIVANAFLQHMVRNITGTLVAIGLGQRPVTWAADVLASCDRRKGGVTAPPQGLTLTGVRYPEHVGLPDDAM